MPTIPWISLKMVSTLQMVFVHNTVDFVKNGVHTADGVHNTVDGVNKWDKGRKQQRLPGSSWSTQPYSRQQAQSFLWFFREFLWNDDFKIFLELLLADGASTVQWGGGRLFDASAEFFFTKTFVTRKWKVEKSIPRWEMNRPSEDYKRAVSKIWGRKAKNGFSGRVLGSKKHTLLAGHHVLDTTRQSCANKKVPREWLWTLSMVCESSTTFGDFSEHQRSFAISDGFRHFFCNLWLL